MKIKLFDGTVQKDKLIAGEVTVKAIDKNGNIVDEKRSNTVVIVGRNTMFQKLTDVTHSVKLESGETINDARGFTLEFFAIGSGGAPAANPLNPVAPSQNDTQLQHYIYIGPDGDKIASDKIHKKLDSKVFASDTEFVVTFSVDYGEANPNSYGNGDTVLINEACLSLANSPDPGDVSQFIMLCRATFSSIEKFPERRLEFEWHLYF